MKKVVFSLIVGAVSCVVMAQTTGVESGHEWVDLGLPGGLKWATVNIGAAAPQDDGDYYAWGETAQKTDFRWATYLHGASQNALSKYTQTDGLMLLAQADDVVSQTWGGAWRMPTQAEWAELKTHCVWTWTDNYNATGVAGYEVASQSGDASLFLPAAGCRYANRVNEKGVQILLVEFAIRRICLLGLRLSDAVCAGVCQTGLESHTLLRFVCARGMCSATAAHRCGVCRRFADSLCGSRHYTLRAGVSDL